MKSRLLVFVVCTILSAFLLSFHPVKSEKFDVIPTEPRSVKASAFAVSPSVSSIARSAFQHPRPEDGSKIPIRQVNENEEAESVQRTEIGPHDADNAVASFTAVPMPTPLLSFDGISNFDNLDHYAAFYIPPDTTGDVGPDHYVQAVNAVIRIFDKNGMAVSPAFKFSDLLAPLGTACSTRNDGDPTVVYDPLADRWLISQFCTAFPPFRQMIAISRTGDPTGQYFVYEFVMPNVRLNDYPKLGAWSDAYYMSSDEFSGSEYVGSGAFAFDRTKMLVGDPSATYIYFHLPQPPPDRIGGILPSDLDGLAAPPDGAPNTFAGYSATEYGDPTDAIRLFDFHADFNNPSNSTFRERAESPIAVAAFDPTSPAGRTDIEQPPPGEWLDSISDRLMYRIAYRNFGDHESLVFNQTVRVSPVNADYRAGVRVYELRRSGGSPFNPVVQSTVGTNAASRWLGSAAQDNKGNIAVAYSYSSEQERPSLLYSGRLASDPPDVLRSEAKVTTGTGVQKAFGYRWGDYSGISADPEDDCTFWITNEYYSQESENYSDFAWLTRIAKFKFAECTPAPRSTITGNVTNAANGQAIFGAVIKAGQYSRTTNAIGTYGNLVMLPGEYLLTVSASGYRDQTVTFTVESGQTVNRNFSLQPIPVAAVTSAVISSESCRINHAAEPGESITLDVALRNTGQNGAADLMATLIPTTSIIAESQTQHYGQMQNGMPPVSRPFNFTVSPKVRCGGEITVALSVSDGANQLGTISIPIRIGEVRYALREFFDRQPKTRLPAGWSSASTGAQRSWTLSTHRAVSSPDSIFSPDPNQIGLNELISPSIFISSRDARLNFQNWYDFETTFLRNRLYDGSVLEISSDSGPWRDILAAGGSFDSGGYDGMIDSCCQNPLAGHMGWSGRSGPNQVSQFITSTVRLPSSVAGHTIRFRWRVGTDIGTFREGQYIDDIEVTDGYSCSCASTVADN